GRARAGPPPGAPPRRSLRSVPFVDPRSSTCQAPFLAYRRACTCETYVSWRRIAHRSPRPISPVSRSLPVTGFAPPASCTTTCVGDLPPFDGLAVLVEAGVRGWVAPPRLRPPTSTATERIARNTKKESQTRK